MPRGTISPGRVPAQNVEVTSSRDWGGHTMGTIATGGALHLFEGPTSEDPLERVASELRYPLTAIRLTAEGLLRQLEDTQGDPTEIDAARTLIHSVERMSQLVHALTELNGFEPT